MGIGTIRKSLEGQLDEGDIRLLRKLFALTESRIQGVPVDRFRADNYSQLPRINRLERGFMERQQRPGVHIQIYRLSLLALAVLNTQKSRRYLTTMKKVLPYVKRQYRKNLHVAIPVQQILTDVGLKTSEETMDALDYFRDTPGISTNNQEFPRADGSAVMPQEQILDFKDFEQVLSRLRSYVHGPQMAAHSPFQMGFGDEDERISLLQEAAAELTESWMSALPEKFHPLIREIEAGLKAGQLALPCFGLRSLVEMTCFDKVGQHKHFKDSVKALVDNGSLSQIEGRQVSALYRYGSTLIHSGLMPEVGEVRSAMTVIVGMLRRLYHTQAAADRLDASAAGLAAGKSGEASKSKSEISYFAYGSNMFEAWIRSRVPGAVAVGVASLPGYSLQWHKVSKDGSGKCDIVTSKDSKSIVNGVLFTIPADQKPALDRAEGLGLGYEESEFLLDINGKKLRALAYYATETDSSLKPYSWYRDLVIAGAVEHGLPADYLSALMAVTAKEMPNEHQANVSEEILSAARALIARHR